MSECVFERAREWKGETTAEASWGMTFSLTPVEKRVGTAVVRTIADDFGLPSAMPHATSRANTSLPIYTFSVCVCTRG